MIRVDELAFRDRRGRLFCHLTADTIDELHEFAGRMGLKRCWFHRSRTENHYDLTAGMRQVALSMGAVFVPALEQARARIAARAKLARKEE